MISYTLIIMKISIFFNLSLLATTLGFSTGCGKDDPTPVTPAGPQNDIAIVDKAVEEFMTHYHIPGLSLAITKNEKLVYVKGYGYADKEAGEKVTRETLFRIASVSKSITGIAFMHLLDEGLINLDNKVFGEGAILETNFGINPYNAYLEAVTVRHLLNHTVGAWSNTGYDPMFSNPTMNVEELITWTLDNYPLTEVPGNTYAYSNFGYCILGRVIEKITGESYETYVIDKILSPLGVNNMRIGGNSLADRVINESKYYGTQSGGLDPYAYQIKRMDAHGGWIASPAELLRLMVRVDGYSSKSDILSTSAINVMTTAPNLAVRSYYGAGWAVNDAHNWWHLGSLPGTTSEWVRANNGYAWAIITNTRSGGNETNDFDALMWNILAQSPAFQDIDQFD